MSVTPVTLQDIAALEDYIVKHPDGVMLLYVVDAANGGADVAVFRVTKTTTPLKGVDYVCQLVVSRQQHDRALYQWNWMSQWRLALVTLLETGMGHRRLGMHSLLAVPAQC